MGQRISRTGAQAQREHAKCKWHSTLLRSYFAPLRLCGLLLFVILSFTQLTAQQRAPVKETEKTRREKAVELIIETAETARGLKDLFYRARLQTLAADALWPQDAARARAIFRNAWEAATAYDKAEEEAEERESGIPSALAITEARDEVLTKAAARDAKLAEVFLSDLLKAKQDEKSAEQNQQTNPRRTPWRELSEAAQRRLALAYELLDRNETARAAEIASPIIAEGVSADLITFIILLRDQDETEADTLYARLIARTGADAQADANDVLLLSAPLVSRRLLVVVDAQGALLFRIVPRVRPNYVPFIEQSAVRAFYQTAADILLRPRAPRAGVSTTPDSIALYFAIGRLLPFFEREATQFVSALRLRSSTLANDIEGGRRESLNEQSQLDSLTPERPGDPLRAQLDQLGRARDSQDRDRIALGIVKKAAGRRLWDRARRAALEIEDLSARHAAQSYIAVCQIADLLHTFEEDKENNFESMAKFVRNADVPPLASAWGLAQAAVIAARRGDTKSVAALFDEAQTYAARTHAGTWERVAAYTAIARLAAKIFDLKRVWELAPEIVRAANAVEDYAGDEASIDIRADESDAVEAEALEPLSVEADVFRLDGFFATIAQNDYEKALTAARSLGRETPRAFATLAIAKVMLAQESELKTQK